MEMNKYQLEAIKTTGTYGDDMRIMAALGLAGESGEVCDILKKWAYHGHEFDWPKLGEEIGDVLWYVAIIAHACGFDLDEIARKNIEKLRKRYPDGFTSERSINREEHQQP
jgi:NTP pyrophosphatase (non-canonical NTP hydrolase)